MNDQKILDRFNAVYEKIFPLSDPNNQNSRSFNINALTDENISILLSWPGILAIKIAEQTGEKELTKKLEILKKQLKPKKDDTTNIYKTIHPIIQTIMSRLFFLVHPKSMPLDYDIIKNLFFSVSQYFLLVCFLVRYKVAKEKKICLSFENIVEILDESSGDNLFEKIMIFLGLYWLALAQGVVLNETNRHFKNIRTSYPASTIPIGSENLTMYQRRNDDEYFCYIEQKGNDDPNSFGFGIDINQLNNIHFRVWMMEFSHYDDDCSDQNKSKENQMPPFYGYFFENHIIIDESDITKELLKCIFKIANETCDEAKAISDMWDDFITKPEKHINIKTNLPDFESWIKAIINSPQYLEEFKNFNSLFAAVGSADLKIKQDKEIITTVTEQRKALINKLKCHISPQDQKKLIEAHNEIKNFFMVLKSNQQTRLVVGKETKWVNSKIELDKKDITNLDGESVMQFLEKKKNKSNYLKYIDTDLFQKKFIEIDEEEEDKEKDKDKRKDSNIIRKIIEDALVTLLHELNGNPYDLKGSRIMKIIGISR